MHRTAHGGTSPASSGRQIGLHGGNTPRRAFTCLVLALAFIVSAAAQDQQGASSPGDGLQTDVGAERVLGFAARLQNQLNKLLGVRATAAVSDGGSEGSPRLAAAVPTAKTEPKLQEEESRGTDSAAAAGSGVDSGSIAASVPGPSNMTIVHRISLPAGQSARLLPDTNRTAQAEGKGVAHIEGELGNICWSSHRLEFPSGSGAGKEQILPGGGLISGGLMMYGDGCRTCLAGELCSFTVLLVGYNTRWLTRKRTYGSMSSPRPQPLGDPFNWELPITLHGPALAAAQVTAVADSARILSVSFRVWDAGQYLINVSNPCLNLQIEGQTITHPVIAQIPLEVKEPPVPLPGPCLYLQHGRWLRTDDGQYRWTQYDCAREMPPISDVPALLQKKGIFEINIIGDSHLRLLTLHMHHLFLAPPGQEETPTYPYHKVDKHTWAFFEVPVANSTRPLKLNFHFATFIPTNQQFGCMAQTWDYRMKVSRTADVNVINVGAWTGTFCELKEQAIEPHVHNALRWAHAATNRKRLIFRTTTVPARGPNCLSTNSFVTWAVGIQKALAQRYQARVFDSYSVEAPRFFDSCPADVHFHCTHKVGNESAYMEGVVGRALVTSFLEFLLYQMP